MKRRFLPATVALILSALAQAQTLPQTGAPAGTAGRPALPEDQIAARQRAQQAQLASDWPNLARYREANRNLAPAAEGENRVVFMGDSITELWDRDPANFFAGRGYLGRGIGGPFAPYSVLRRMALRRRSA